MADRIHWATDPLGPVWRQLIADVLGAKVMHVDSTGLPVRDRDREGGIVLGSLWGYVGDETNAVYSTRPAAGVSKDYNEVRPHGSLDNWTTMEFSRSATGLALSAIQ